LTVELVSGGLISKRSGAWIDLFGFEVSEYFVDHPSGPALSIGVVVPVADRVQELLEVVFEDLGSGKAIP